MEVKIFSLLDNLKLQAEEIDNRYKAMIDICNDIEKIIDNIQHDVHKLDKELDNGSI